MVGSCGERDRSAHPPGAGPRRGVPVDHADTAMTIVIPADVRLVRPVRLAVGGLASLVGFDVEAIDDLRIAVDELCIALIESGDGSRIELLVAASDRTSIRVEGTVVVGDHPPEPERFALSRQILSVVADQFGFEEDGGRVRGWLARDVDRWEAGDGVADAVDHGSDG